MLFLIWDNQEGKIQLLFHWRSSKLFWYFVNLDTNKNWCNCYISEFSFFFLVAKIFTIISLALSIIINRNNKLRYLATIHKINFVQLNTAQNSLWQLLLLLCLHYNTNISQIKNKIKVKIMSFCLANGNYHFFTSFTPGLSTVSTWTSDNYTWIVNPRSRIPCFNRSRNASNPFLEM